jgi:hypothetical protein
MEVRTVPGFTVTIVAWVQGVCSILLALDAGDGSDGAFPADSDPAFALGSSAFTTTSVCCM